MTSLTSSLCTYIHKATYISTATKDMKVQLAIIKDGFQKKDNKLGPLLPSKNYSN